MKVAIFYGRFSSDEQDKGTSKQRQLEGFQAFLRASGLPRAKKDYFDEGVSGFTGEQLEAEFGQMMKDIQNGVKPTQILCFVGQVRNQKKQQSVSFARLKTMIPNLNPLWPSWKRLEVRPPFVKVFNRDGQAKWWYHYLGSIAPTSFKVELRAKGGYIPLTEPDKLIGAINSELEHFEFFNPTGMPWALAVRTKKGEERSSWIFDEIFPGERFK